MHLILWPTKTGEELNNLGNEEEARMEKEFFLENRVYISNKGFGDYSPNLTRIPLKEKKITTRSL
jgi:hypothetical protein